MFGVNSNWLEAWEDEDEPHHNHDVDMLERPQGFLAAAERYCLIETVHPSLQGALTKVTGLFCCLIMRA